MMASLILGASSYAQTNRISLVGSSTATGYGGSYSLSVPAGIQANDLLLAVLSSSRNDVDSSITGFTEVSDLYLSGYGNLYVGYKIAEGSETSVTVGPIDVVGCAAMIAFRGVHLTSPMDAAAANAYYTTSAINPASYTTTTNGAWVICCTARGDSSSPAADISAASNMTNIVGRTKADITAGVERSCSLRVASKKIVGAGAFDPGEFACSRSGGLSTVIALRPRY